MHATRVSIGNIAHALTKELAVLLGFLGVALVGLVDMALGADISLLTVHLIPVLFAAWYASLRWGIFFAALMTAISAAIIADAPPGTINPWYRYLDLASDFVAILLLVYIQSRLRASYDHVQHLSRSDALTGCWNKSGFAEQLQLEIDRQKRYNHAFSLVYFDCDNFKTVNDTHGHHVGDALLAEIGRVLRSELRAVDTIGRLGGDEFAVLLHESDIDAARHAVEFMRRALDTAMRAHQWPVSFSMGIASFERPPANAATALSLADALMYEVKRHGKNSVRERRF